MGEQGEPEHDDQKGFFVTLLKKEGELSGYRISREVPSEGKEAAPPKREKPKDEKPESAQLDFAGVLRTYRTAMDAYRNFIPLTLFAYS
ncbi:MAG TPA: hypothetical protein VHX92_01580 [Rhizomicrobium sp.]|jgi:hypothetical protein|nr:hypothetical protein [Rhizomicrobium sp.]